METRLIDAEILPAFQTYLLPEAAEAIRDHNLGIFACGAVTEKNQTCGAACVFLDLDGTLIVNSLYVDPQVRRQGVADLMLDALEKYVGFPITEAQWFAPQQEVPGLEAYFAHRNMKTTLEGPVMRLDCSAMANLPVCRRAFLPEYRPDSNVISMSEVTDSEKRELLQDAQIPEFLRIDRFSEDELNSPLSVAYRYHGVIAAYFLAIPIENGAVVKAAVSRSMAHGGAFFQLAYAAMHRSIPYLNAGSSYWLEAINDRSETLARYLSKDHVELWYNGFTYSIQ